jgi:hypothetical protein
MHFFLVFGFLSIGVYANSLYNFDYIENNITDISSNFFHDLNTESPYTLSKNYEKVVIDLAYLQLFAIATIGVIALLPEEISQWSEEDKALYGIEELLEKHANNIKDAPRIDNDNNVINYIGHPVSGSYFYVWGRQSGLSWQESFMLTTLMSTFYWEYGWEAFAEVPSTQDLIITPILGAVLGEGTNYLYNQIMFNKGKIYNSEFLGDLGRGLLNPIGEANNYLKKAFAYTHIEISVDYSYTQNENNYNLRNIPEDRGLIQSYFRLNFNLKY